ncbi:MAG: DUF305 domain-containing protein [Pedobacter sp.]|nr:MAG: DUF305 domain-containing protein [Pedobacter sp.]
MKKIMITLTAAAVIFIACNQADSNKEAVNEHDKMEHGATKSTNVMMDAMDASMVDMHHAKMTGNADYDFASMMIPHHEGAVVMAEAVVKQGKSLELIAFSKKVIDVQNQEITTLKEFLKTANQQAIKDSTEFKSALNASMIPMMKGMEQVKLTDNIDKDFVALMIPHHQSAVDMAKAYLPFASNAQMKLMAQQIIQAQENEIKWLKTQ